jgi:ubiquinone/menaquinone biosynthesis C-methylase UbiE
MQHPDVHAYYDNTRFDYRVIWNRRRRDVAVHFGYYDERADRHTDALDNLNRALAGLADIRAGERVLDAGCGLGNSAFWLAEHRGAQVTGINIVASQVADCQKIAAKKKSRNVEFLQADFCKIPFSEKTFDLVWACESVCHAADKAAFYREAFRVLKPGGRLVMAEYMRAARPLPPESERLLAAWLRPWAIPDIGTAAEHRAHALAAGFQQVEIKNATGNVRVSLRNLHETSVRWLPFGRFLNLLGLVNNVRLGNAEASVCQYEALQAGAWEYGLLWAMKE